MYFWQNFWTLNQTDNFTSNYKRILFLCKIFKYVFSTFHNRMSLPLYSEKYARKWRGRFSSVDDEPIKFDRYRFAGNSNSSSMDETRKNRVIVATGTLHAPPSFSLDNRTRPRTRWGGEGSIRRIITVETFTPFGIPWEKHSIPERRKCGEAKEREAAAVWSVKKSRGTSEQLFDFRTTLPLSQRAELREKVGWLLLLSPS